MKNIYTTPFEMPDGRILLFETDRPMPQVIQIFNIKILSLEEYKKVVENTIKGI